ncbi:MAG: ABC transporter ATP-binding protein [Candidatus Limnocylindrales bacterium]
MSAGTVPVPARLSVRGVGLAYGAHEVLRDVSFELGAGERLAVVGPNGAGKSSLLRCLTGLAPGARGAVAVDGLALGALGREALARRIAVVPQLSLVPFALRVEALVGLGRIPHEDPWRGPGAADREAVDRAIELVGLEDLRQRDVRHLSLGERQLALVAMALAQSAPLLLLDEPTVHLDIRHRVRIMEVLVELAERDGVSVIAVLHDIGLARHFFPRLLLLDQGGLVADGPPERVLAPAFAASVFGVRPELLAAASSP